MPLFIEGIGGTGKAVVNILKFTEALAAITENSSPAFNCSVIDQDPDDIWPQVDHHQPIRQSGGTFASAFGITTPQIESAAKLLFSESELQTDISRGFHAHPKLAASLGGTWNPPVAAQANVHVLIYSDIGGTGAGLGPVRLRQLIADPTKTHVIAIVYGKYLSCGTPNTTGYQWLKQHEVALQANQTRRCQWFTGFYVSVPLFSVTGQIPSSGLNQTPALLLASAYVWRVARAMDENTLDDLVGTNNRRGGPAKVDSVGFNSTHFVLTQQTTREDAFISTLRSCALADNLTALLPKSKSYLNRPVRDFLAGRLANECWRVFGAREPQGAPLGRDVNYAGCFQETFTSVSDTWAAASWFHYAVQSGDLTCQNALQRLVSLYVLGRLHVVRTKWGPDGSEIYALSTRPISETDPNYKGEFSRSIVGAFSREFPFWTVPAFLPNLLSIPADPKPFKVSLQVARRAEAGGIYGPAYSIPEAPDIRCRVEFVCVDTVEPNEWQWLLHLEADRWIDFRTAVSKYPLMEKNIDLLEGSLNIGESYKCVIKGVQINKSILPHDGVFFSDKRGQQYYEIEVSEANKRPESVARLAAALNDPAPLEVNTPVAVVLVGNIMARFHCASDGKNADFGNAAFGR